MGHPRLSATLPFDRVHTTSCSTLTETKRLVFCFRVIASYLSKVANFYIPTCIWRPFWGDPVRI